MSERAATSAGGRRSGARRLRLSAAVAGILTVVLTVDPFGLSLLSPGLAAHAATLESRSDHVGDVIAGLELESAIPASEMTGDWDEIDQFDDELEAAAWLPDADEKPIETGTTETLGERMDVKVEATPDETAPDEVLIQVADPEDAAEAGIAGVLLQVSDATENEPEEDAKVKLTVSYGSFAALGGAEWASRLQFFWLPDCEESGPDCLPTPVKTDNDLDEKTVSAVVDVAPAEGGLEPQMVGSPSARMSTGGGAGGSYAVMAGASGPLGDWSATPLSPSSLWGAGGSTGSFTWSMPLTAPAVPAGPAPDLTVSYASSASDGRLPSTNNQTGWIGEGFDLSTGYIERSYVPCKEDTGGSALNDAEYVTGDLCWGAENATMVFNGTSVELIRDESSGAWRAKNDDGTKIERLGSPADTGQSTTEYWKVTTTDGFQYFFGRGKRPTDSTALHSAWKVPVYGNHTNDPCYNHSTQKFGDSLCTQVWRWNLEYVIDPSGNSMTYFYKTETNHYVYDVTNNYLAGETESYISGGRLDKIEYGTIAGQETTQYDGNAPARVVFVTAPRCITSLGTPDSWCSSGQTNTSQNHWLDTPADLICIEDQEDCTNYTPIFFSRYRLKEINTFVRDGGVYEPVDTWTISQKFVPQGYEMSLRHSDGHMLIATKITRKAHGGDRPDITLPPNEFGYAFLPNQVDAGELDGYAILNRPRINVIHTDSGATIGVNYKTDPEDPLVCGPENMPQSAQSNAKLCFPVKWYPAGDDVDHTDYFHKYVVDSLVEYGSTVVENQDELRTGSLARVTSYTYTGGAAWAKPTGAMVKPKNETYSDFLGFKEVTTTVGLEEESSSTRTLYYRGTGDTLPPVGPSGHQVPVTDHIRFRGMVLAEIVLGPGGKKLSETITKPGSPVTVATNSKGVKATRVPSSTTYSFTYAGNGEDLVYRTSSTSTYDANSQLTETNDLGELDNRAGFQAAEDDLCTTIAYAHASDSGLAGKHLVSLAAETVVVAAACGQSGDLVSHTTATYDASGRALAAHRYRHGEQGASDGFVLVSEVLQYDSRGRPTEVEDVAGNVTHYEYVHTSNGLLSKIVTTPPDADGGEDGDFATVSEFDVILGVVKATEDQNGLRTSGTFDALGRLVTVRYPQDVAAGRPYSVRYSYEVRSNGLNAVMTETLGADGETFHASVLLHDGLLRIFQEQVEGRNAAAKNAQGEYDRGRMVAHVYYDSAGRVATRTGQWWVQDGVGMAPVDPIPVPPSQTVYEYDAAGRVTAEIFYVGNTVTGERWRTVTGYDGAMTTVVPPMGGIPQSVVMDARGRTIELIEYPRDPDVHDEATTVDLVRALPGAQSTKYEYNAAGLRSRMLDPELNEWTFEYDWAGRLIEADDPDGGTTVTTYDLLDRTVTVTTAHGTDDTETLAYTYDALGRPTTQRDDAINGNVRIQWQYDQARFPDDEYAVGPVSAMTRFEGGQPYTTEIPSYDFAYRTLASTVTLPALQELTEVLESTSFTTTFSYAADGQPAQVTLPRVASDTGTVLMGEETVTTHFDAASMPSWMGGGFGWGTYVAQSRFLADGRPVIADLGNTYGAVVSYRYDEGTNRLSNIGLTRQGFDGATDVDLSYSYDDAGNVVSAFDQPTMAGLEADNQCFDYDGLRRLIAAWSSAEADCDIAPDTTNAVDGAAPYWFEYEYDELGNRTKLTQNDVPGTPDKTVMSYEHGEDGAGPHQLTSMSEVVNNGTPTVTNFVYDGAGNRVEKDPDSGDATEYTWDAEGELVSVDGAEYVYDVHGNRLVRTDEDGAITIYLPGGQEITIDGEGVSVTRYYSFGGQSVAVRSGKGMDGVDSLVNDPNGTPIAVVDNTEWTAAGVQRVYSDPFGGVRGDSDSDMPGDHRFLGATRDETGLSLLGARYYDPATSTFLSVDPLIDPMVPAQFNAYSYGWNNPVTFPDPTGMAPTGGKMVRSFAKKPPAGGSGKTKAQAPASAGPAPLLPIKTWTRDMIEKIVANPQFVRITQNPTPEQAFWFDVAGFARDKKGNWHARQDRWQQFMGYAEVYDVIFDLGTSMDADNWEFEYEEENYILWAWKGDYLNLGAGAELGIYRQSDGPLKDAGIWFVDPSLALPMSMSLSDATGEIASYAPDEPQWWITSFNPNVQDPSAASLSATFTVDFSGNEGMFEAFRDAHGGPNSLWTFNPRNSNAKLDFRRRRYR